MKYIDMHFKIAGAGNSALRVYVSRHRTAPQMRKAVRRFTAVGRDTALDESCGYFCVARRPRGEPPQYLVAVAGHNRDRRIAIATHEIIHLVSHHLRTRKLPRTRRRITREEWKCLLADEIMRIYLSSFDPEVRK